MVNKLVLVALIVVQIGFGGVSVILSKYAKDNIDPLIFCMFQYWGCLPVMFLASLILEKKILLPEKRDLPILFLMGFIGLFGARITYVLGVYYTTANIASIFQPVIPIWTFAFAVLGKIERFPNVTTMTGAAKIFGVLLAVAGAVVMCFGRNSKQAISYKTKNSDSLLTLGYLALVASTSLSGVYIVIQKKYVFKVSTSRWKKLPINLTAWTYVVGTVCTSIASLYYFNRPEKFRNFKTEIVYPLLYSALVQSALCFILISWCNMQVSSTYVTAFWPLQVLFCIVLAYFVLGETLSVIEICGGIMIILGMFSVVWSSYREERVGEVEEILAEEQSCANPKSGDEEPLIL